MLTMVKNSWSEQFMVILEEKLAKFETIKRKKGKNRSLPIPIYHDYL